jgi:hypothetical protein
MNPHLASIWTAGAALTSNLRESALMGEGVFNSKTRRPVGPAHSRKTSSASPTRIKLADHPDAEGENSRNVTPDQRNRASSEYNRAGGSHKRWH